MLASDMAIPVVGVESEEAGYSGLIALKKGVWGAVKSGTAVMSTRAIIQSLSDVGVVFTPGSLAAKAAPVVIPVVVFVILHLYHDYAKVSTGLKWL